MGWRLGYKKRLPTFREMKLSNKILIIIALLPIIIIIGIGLLFIHNGFEMYFIHKIPNIGDSIQKDVYDSLLNLYQTRINIVNWGIACIGAILTFLAFYVQYADNNRQKEDLALERYENQLFHLLDVYRNICHDTSIENVGYGKVAYHYMFYEYKSIFNMIKKSEKILNEIPKKNDVEAINYIAFTYFINGVSANKIDTTIDKKVLSDEGKKIIRDMLLTRQKRSENSGSSKNERGVEYLKDYRNKSIKYFDGHRPRFVPYIKYISLILEFIKEKSIAKNYDSIKFLIKEQTDHEIGLIYAYNGYRKYSENSTTAEKATISNKNTDFLNELWEQMYNDITEHMKHKFKYNDDEFLS